MLNRSYLALTLALPASCATTQSKPAGFRAGPGPVGVVFAPPANFTPSISHDLNDDLLFGPQGSLLVLRISDLPFPLADDAAHVFGGKDQIDQATVDAWAARYTRAPDVALVSAHSLFWDRDRRIGAMEVTYKNVTTHKLAIEHESTARIAIVATEKGICTISLVGIVGMGKVGERAWQQILEGISVAREARPAAGMS